MNVAFIGRPGSGKSTAARLWSEITGAKLFSFADVGKIELFDLLEEYRLKMRVNKLDEFKPWPDRMFGPPLSNFTLPPLGQGYFDDQKILWFNSNKWNLRPLIQWYATEYKRSIWPDYWIKKIAANESIMSATSLVNDDCRFHNEAEWLQSQGFVFVRVMAHSHDQRVDYTHRSETEQGEVMERYCTITLYNDPIDGTLDALRRQLIELEERFVE